MPIGLRGTFLWMAEVTSTAAAGRTKDHRVVRVPGWCTSAKIPAPYASYVKGSNASQQDWSDVIRLTDVLNNAPDETYLEELEQIADIDEWLRTIAMLQLSGYSEASLLVR